MLALSYGMHLIETLSMYFTSPVFKTAGQLPLQGDNVSSCSS